MFTWPKIIKKPKGRNILILAPHMDDEIIGCGGVVQKHKSDGDNITVIYFTAGDKGNKDFQSDSDLSKIRKSEIMASNDLLGIKNAYFLDFPDGTDDFWDTKKEYLESIFNSINPDLVYLPPYFDLHLDHRKVNWLFKNTLGKSYKGTLCVYEVWTPINPNIVINITAQIENKLKAINLCKSQINSLDYNELIKSLNSYRSKFAMSPLVKYAEAFYMISAQEYFSKFSMGDFDWKSADNKCGGKK